MAGCLISLSEDTVAMLMAIKGDADESLDSVVRRVALNATGALSTTTGCVEKIENGHRVVTFGHEIRVRTAQAVLVTVLESLAARDETFLSRLAQEQGRSRRIVARAPEALYPGSAHLAKYARKITGGWLMATNCSKRDISRSVEIACRVADIRFGQDVSIEFM